MKNVLNCFRSFKCIKGDCKKTCCALWQINVDKKTLKKYKKVKGEFSAKIKEGVNFACSSLCVNDGRCAFLNKDNLCDIIINLGEDYLSEVCAVHPRFMSSLKNYSEIGVGISCEEGARLLLSFEGEIRPDTPPKLSKLKGFEREIISFREKVLGVIYKDIPLKEKFIDVLALLGINEEKFLELPFLQMLECAELLDKDWLKYLKVLKEFSFNFDKNVEKEVINLLAYFIYRHLINAVDNLDLKARTLFSLLSTLTIHNIYINSKKVQKDFNLLLDIARGFSAEIEYSETNFFNILDKLEVFIIKQTV